MALSYRSEMGYEMKPCSEALKEKGWDRQMDSKGGSPLPRLSVICGLSLGTLRQCEGLAHSDRFEGLGLFVRHFPNPPHSVAFRRVVIPKKLSLGAVAPRPRFLSQCQTA